MKLDDPCICWHLCVLHSSS